MPEKIRALVVIVALAVPAFYLARQVAVSIIPEREFVAWRNAWFAVTSVAFLSGSFILHELMLLVICVYANTIRAATPSLYFILLFCVPLGYVVIGGGGIVNYLIDFNNARMLSIVLLLPLLLKARGANIHRVRAFGLPDGLVVIYAMVPTALSLRNSEATNVMRQAVAYSLDILIPYFAFSRLVTSMADFRKVCLAFLVALIPLSLIAAFELVKSWRLYAALTRDWGGGLGYLRRGGLLRASGPAFTAISFGYMSMVAVGCLLALWQAIRPMHLRKAAGAILLLGLFASLSKGPWVGTIIVIGVFLATGTGATANLSRMGLLAMTAVGVFFLTPAGKAVMEMLPFIGNVDTENVEYRKQLFENSMIVIQRNLWFGSADFRAAPEMQELIQGQGIVDIVNSYLNIALSSGIVGLALFAGFFLSILNGLRRVLKFNVSRDSGFHDCVRASIATLVGILVTIATVSSIDFIAYIYWSFAGLSVALIRIGYMERASAMQSAFVRRVAA